MYAKFMKQLNLMN